MQNLTHTTRIIQERTGQFECTVFSGHADGVEIEDLSIDCGFQNQQVVDGNIRANAATIVIGGSHLAIRRCYFINYGSPYDKFTGENFAVFIGSPDPANGENLVVEDCIFAGMSPLLKSGQTVLTIAGGPRTNALTVGNWARGSIARRNHFTGHHPGCRGITLSGSQGGLIIDNVFEHFMGSCVYHDTWPQRDIIIARNIMSDVNQGVRLTCDFMDNFQIRDNIILLHDGFDIMDVKDGVVTTVIEHGYRVGSHIRFHDVNITAGQGLTGEAYVTSVPTLKTFTYALSSTGTTETADSGTGGYIQPINYPGICPESEGVVVISTRKEGDERQPRNFVIAGNVIKAYNNGDVPRLPSVGIAVRDLRNGQIIDNVIVDSGERKQGSKWIDEIIPEIVPPGPGQHAEILVCSTAGRKPVVICRNNYHPDGTPVVPRDEQFRIFPDGLTDLPFSAGRNITFTPDGGRVRIDAAAASAGPLSRRADAAKPEGDARSPGQPGDYAVGEKYLYIYTGDGEVHQWKRAPLADY